MNLKCNMINWLSGCLVFLQNVFIIVQSTNTVFIQYQCYCEGNAIQVRAILIANQLRSF